MPYFHMFYGDVVRVGPNMVSVADKDMIKEILFTKDYPKSNLYNGMNLNGQTNIFTATDSGYHKHIVSLTTKSGVDHTKRGWEKKSS